jgi:23S rRNA (adenine2503-C2)-methyltransferase
MYLVNEAEKMEFISYSDLNTLCEKFQIMFMSMGEPLLNIDTVISSIHELHHKYTNAQLLISTIGINNQKNLQQLLTLSINIDKVGLQFSIHDAFDEDRDKIIPYRRKLNLREIRDYAIEWNKNTHRPVFLNYCVTDKNITCEKINRLMDLFSPKIFNFTFSVICEKEKGKKTETDMNLLYDIQTKFLDIGYNVRIFDPAGKDTIGGGCGQLHETQEYFKTYDK